jgi:hypothetical protein
MLHVFEKKKNQRRSDGTKELSTTRIGLRNHADNDNHGNEPIVGDCLGLLHDPFSPFFDSFNGGSPLKLSWFST